MALTTSENVDLENIYIVSSHFPTFKALRQLKWFKFSQTFRSAAKLKACSVKIPHKLLNSFCSFSFKNRKMNRKQEKRWGMRKERGNMFQLNFFFLRLTSKQQG